ncbi:recombinase RecA, partial [Bacillus safensis]
GRENAKQFLKENKDIMLMIQEQIREHYGLDNNGTVQQESEEALEQLELE